MKRPLLLAAIALLVVSNAWVLAHVAMNRAGEPDTEMQLTARELNYNGRSFDDSSVVLTVLWDNTAPEYPALPPLAGPGWFDQKKLEEVGFDLGVPANASKAQQFYSNLRSREAFVALEFEGPSWAQWLKDREPQLRQQSQYSPQISFADYVEIERQTSSRLVAIDAARDPVELRRRYPDRKRVMILKGLVRVIWETARSTSTPAYLRGAITRLAIPSITVPQPLSQQFDSLSFQGPWTMDGKNVKITPPRFALTLRVGSKYEPWVVDVKLLR